MTDIPTGWLSLVTLVLTAVGTAFGAAIRKVMKDKDDQITALKDEVKLLRAKIEELNDKSISALNKQLDEVRAGRETYERLARSQWTLASAVESNAVKTP